MQVVVRSMCPLCWIQTLKKTKTTQESTWIICHCNSLNWNIIKNVIIFWVIQFQNGNLYKFITHKLIFLELWQTVYCNPKFQDWAKVQYWRLVMAPSNELISHYVIPVCTIMGMTAAPTVVQETVMDTLSGCSHCCIQAHSWETEWKCGWIRCKDAWDQQESEVPESGGIVESW